MTLSRKKPRTDDRIDAIVDGLVRDPSEAKELKSQLHRRFVIVERESPKAVDDVEDLWNNVPV